MRCRLAAILAVAATLACVKSPATASPAWTVPDPVPATSTPSVLDGAVKAIAKVGDSVVLAGTFTHASSAGAAVSRIRKHVLAFDPDDGSLSPGFAPRVNGAVFALEPGTTSGTVFIAGAFTRVNGEPASHVALLDLATGQVERAFRSPVINGDVNSIAVSKRQLLLGGFFSSVGGAKHQGIASLNAAGGQLTHFMKLNLSGHHNDTGSGAQGRVGIRQLDVSPDGVHLIAIGNFTRVDAVGRNQIALIDLGDSAVVDRRWATRRFHAYCLKSRYDSYVRGVQFSPDGSYFVVTSTGGPDPGTLCDAAARFNVRSVGSQQQPVWVDSTGGDTLWTTAVTKTAVYVGGHERWMNNPQGHNNARQGAVPRPGLAALDPRTGLPMAWNPGRNPRGAGAFALLATGDGLWVGSDTEWIGNFRYRRPRIAFFPLASGTRPPNERSASLPSTVYMTASSGSGGEVMQSVFDGMHATPLTPGPTIDDSWLTAQASFMVGGTVFALQSDGSLYSRSFDGSSFGIAERIDPYHDPAWMGVPTGSGNDYDGRFPDFYTQFPNVRGIFYFGARLYFTVAGSSTLHSRSFSLDSGAVGADERVVQSAVSWSGTGPMFYAGGYLYFVDNFDGSLSRVAFSHGSTVGASVVVNRELDWRRNGLFLSTLTGG